MENLKAVAFTPFKVDAKSWHPRAIELALRPWAITPVYRNPSAITRVVAFEEFAGRSPLSYSVVLDFLMKISSSKSSRRPLACEIAFLDTSKTYTITTTFSEPFDASSAEIKRLRNLIAPVLDDLRDWRLHGSTLGNWQAPFVEMSNRLLGVVKRPKGAKVPEGCWCLQEEKLDDNMIISLENSQGHRFHIRLEDNSSQGVLTLEWK